MPLRHALLLLKRLLIIYAISFRCCFSLLSPDIITLTPRLLYAADAVITIAVSLPDDDVFAMPGYATFIFATPRLLSRCHAAHDAY